MSPRRRILAASLGAALALAVIWWLFRTPGPYYQGKALDDWLAQGGDMPSGLDAPAQAAVRTLGTNALPRLRDLLRQEDSPLRQTLQRWSDLMPWDGKNLLKAAEKRLRAHHGLQALGPLAKPAIPDLCQQLGGYDENLATQTLIAIGPEGVTALIRETAFRHETAGGLVMQTIPLEKPEMTEMFARLLKNDELAVQLRVTRSLAFRPDRPAVLMPGLADNLHSRHPMLREASAFALARYGTNALAAWPALLAALQSPDCTEAERRSLAHALWRIDAANAAMVIERPPPEREFSGMPGPRRRRNQ